MKKPVDSTGLERSVTERAAGALDSTASRWRLVVLRGLGLGLRFWLRLGLRLGCRLRLRPARLHVLVVGPDGFAFALGVGLLCRGRLRRSLRRDVFLGTL